MSKPVNNPGTTVIPMIGEVWTSEATKHRRRSIIREFALNTSTHGLPGIARSESKRNRIFWTISFLIFTGVMIFFVTETIKNYFQYPTQTTVSIIVEQSQTFPAVTFCNYAPARYDRIIGPLLNYTHLFNVTNTTTDRHIFTLKELYILRDFLLDKLNAGESTNEYFYSLDTMLISCLYNNKVCTADNFISFSSSMHGFCYTFNAKTKKGNGSEIRNTNDNGGSGKLQLRLYAQSHLYIPVIVDDVSAGMVAMIHDNTQLPQIDIAGIMLTPGRRHQLGYKKKTTYFLPSPYTECTNKIPPVMQAMFNRYEGADYAYSQTVCHKLCTQAYIYQQCGCVSPLEWSARSVVLPGTNTVIEAPLCPSMSTCFSNATVRLSNIASIWNEFCSNCSQECSTVDFLITPSSLSAPSLAATYLTRRFIELAPVPLPPNWATNWPLEIKNNYVSLDVACESTQVENYTQEASVSPVDVLSNVGGHTGLWIGISFLSIMEFIEMLYRMFRYQFHAIKQAIRNKFRRRQEVNIMN